MADRSSIRRCCNSGHDLFQPQAQARERRLQVVGDGGQHLRALGDVLADARLHGVEGGAGLADFGGAAEHHGRVVDVVAEVLGCLRQALERAYGHARHQ
jgi:hypothetical protein